MTPSDTIDIHSYLDGELGPEEAAAIEDRLENDPEARARLEAMARQKELVGAALTGVAGTQAENLRTARLERRLAAALHRRIAPRRAPMFVETWGRKAVQIAAACALVSFGWWGHALWSPGAQGIPEYVSEAVGAHRVFAEDSLRPAEFIGNDVDTAAAWFSNKMGVPVDVPDLVAFNLNLVGARLLGTKEGPLAQFIYEDAGGNRYSLTLARHPVERPLEPLQVVDYPDRSVGYWSTTNIDFALVGNRDAPVVKDLAMTLASVD
ncbi:anti-sigma factor family protein [Mameliella sediminis]|uniref:anti-sigma factor family protein n=1 Tax=Mameliella sediminis TaxID=2836866 RepID=UPI001C459841|nr:hypothetical protein [Mameliella sediminis]MBV7392692.1 hypothetical protein [Mameliella sediminis]